MTKYVQKWAEVCPPMPPWLEKYGTVEPVTRGVHASVVAAIRYRPDVYTRCTLSVEVFDGANRSKFVRIRKV